VFCVHFGGEPLIFAYRTSSGCVFYKILVVAAVGPAQSIPERMCH
jgi:hypothetical protein